MIHLVYSNRTEQLLLAFGEAVRAQRAQKGPFSPIRLVVPNRNVETYVKLGLAEAHGIAANLEVDFLRGLLARLGARLEPPLGLLEAPVIEAWLLRVLHDPQLLSAPVLAPVRDYLLGAGEAADGMDDRRSQLAAQLATLFDEYAASRPEMLRAWRERAVLADDPVLGPLEAWQRVLWGTIFGPRGLAQPRAEALAGQSRLVTLFELAQALLEVPAEATGLADGLHIFGVSYMARGYHAVLAALARQVEVHVYTLNPCREYWEDLETKTELRRRVKRAGQEALFPTRRAVRQAGLVLGDDPYDLVGEKENLPLRLWGRPGRENVRLLGQLGAGDFDGRFVANAEVAAGPSAGRRQKTLLGRLQDDILDRVTPADPAGPAPANPTEAFDGSLVVLPCPGVRRELEVIAAEIWRQSEADPTLALNQIAVVVPEAVKDRYLLHVGAVFSEAHDLPHSIVDLPLSAGHRLGQAVDQLLALPLGGFSRRELLPLLTHPAVLRRFPGAEAADWLKLCDRLGIVHGADHADHRGTYIERDLYNWDQGIRRVVLGALVDPIAGDVPVEFGGEDYLPLALGADERASALGFGLLARSLIEDARFARGLSGPRLRPMPEWLELMRGLIAGYLEPGDGEEETLLARVLATLEEVGRLPFGECPLSYRVAATLVRRALSGRGGARGQYLAHGVTVTSFVPMRAIPFRVIFVAGLGARTFPRPGRRTELDLRAAQRFPGDVDAREQDLYMFLETLLGARDKLFLSYVARDELTGTPLAPSSVILELEEILARGYLSPAARERLFAGADRPPLRRYDDPERARVSRLAARERRAKALGASLRQALGTKSALPDLARLRRIPDQTLFSALAAPLGRHRPPRRLLPGPGEAEVDVEQGGGERLVVPLLAIRQFLEDPLQGSARFRLGLRELEGDEEILERENELFETPRAASTLLLREAMVQAVLEAPGDAQAPAARLTRLCTRVELLGQGPTGFFAAAERPLLEQILHGWWQALVRLGPGPLAGRVIRFGRPQPGDEIAALAQPPILLPTVAATTLGHPRVEVEFSGRSELLLELAGREVSVIFTPRRLGGNDGRERARRARDRLRAFVDYVALAAAGLCRPPGGPGSGHGALLVGTGEGEAGPTDLVGFGPLAPERAQAYLRDVVEDMLDGAPDADGHPTGLHPYLLPCEAVFQTGASEAVVAEIEQMRDLYLEKPWLGFSTVYGPVPQAVERHEPPAAGAAAAMIQRRFGLYFELLQEGGG